MASQEKVDYAELKRRYIAYYSALPIQKLAAQYIHRDEDTIIRWRKEDKDFADQVDEAASAWAKTNAGAVRNREWLLERVMNNHFKAPKQEHEVSGQIKVIPILGGESALPSNDSNAEDSVPQEKD